MMMSSSRQTSLPDLSSWVDARQSQGIYFFTRKEALNVLGRSPAAFKQAAARLVKKKRIARIHRGFFIIIPLEYAAIGILPPEWFIADLMHYIDRPFYVGLLSAAALHGAAHQQPQQFQVVTTLPLRKLRAGGLAIRFFSKSKFAGVPLTSIKVQTGHIPVSAPEATAFDLIRYSRRIGGLDRALTVLQELSEKMEPAKLVQAAKVEKNLACAQRLGFLLEKAGFKDLSRMLFQWVQRQKPLPVKLEPSLPSRGSGKDERWRLLVNLDIEGDL